MLLQIRPTQILVRKLYLEVEHLSLLESVLSAIVKSSRSKPSSQSLEAELIELIAAAPLPKAWEVRRVQLQL